MAKDFSRLLQKGNLTPKERHFLMVANIVSKEKTGKAILTEADIYALTEGWTPQNNDEVKEYNRYNQAWKNAIFAEMDAQTTYLQAKIKYQTMFMMMRDFHKNPIYSEVKKALEDLGKVKKVVGKEAIDIINRQREAKLKGGQTIDGTIYQLALEIIGEETKKKLQDFYEDIYIESEYLDDEQELAELYKKKDFEGIAERVAKRGFNNYIKKYQLFHYYACIPILEIARRYAKENNLPYKGETDDEDIELAKKGLDTATDKLAETLEKHAQENKTTTEELIKTACLKWIGEGLFENNHKPLILADPELLNKWIETKEKARLTLKGLIDKGTLKTGKASESGFFMTSGEEIITGESLYNCGLDYAFIKDFKTYVDEYDPELGLVKDDKGETIDNELLITEEKFFSRYKYLLERTSDLLGTLSIVQEKDEGGETVVDIIDRGDYKKAFTTLRDDFVKYYEILLAFEDFFKRVSKVYDMDLSYRVSAWIAECKENVEVFNDTLLGALEIVLPYSQQANKKKRYKDTELFIDTKKIKPNAERVRLYCEEISTLLGDAF